MKPGPATDEVLLEHMAQCMARIGRYCGGDRARFDGDELVQDGVVRNLQLLAESSQRISEATKAGEPAVPWRELAGFRNIVVHAYLGLDMAVVWSIVERDLPPLSDAVQRMLSRLRNSPR